MKDQIRQELQTLISLINSYHEKYGGNDIRSSFIDGYFQILRTFYAAYFHLDSEDILETYREIYPEVDIKRENLSIHLQGHKNLLNSFLIINCWSNFEFFVTLFSNEILTDIQVDGLLKVDYDRFKKIIKGIEITDSIENKLSKLIKNHIAHTPVMYKYGKLLKLIDTYPTNRNKVNDRDFLDFFGKLRNCIHSNFIYFGSNEYSYTYMEEVFTFVPQSLISQTNSQENSIFRLSQNLKNIGVTIIENIEYDNEIYDPSIGLIE
jgi:hypothetical protein